MPDTGARVDPYPAFRFHVTFDDMPPAGFTDCTGLQFETEIQEYIEGGVNTHSWKFVTRTRQANITLKRGIVDTNLWKWYFDVTEGRIRFRNGAIRVFDYTGSDVVIEFELIKALPSKWVGPDLIASQSSVAVETLEIVHQGIRRRT